ncbi:MAG: trypsin-like peptidase domain-containing protein [Anaerolineae bacterium]
MKTRIIYALKRPGWALILVLMALLALAGPGWYGAQVYSAPPATTPVAPSEPSGPVPSAAEIAALQATMEAIYEQVNPSVVSIQVIQKETISPEDYPDLFPFFGFPNMPHEFYSRGAGSGIVWDTQGHIVTNNHVVQGADKITVTFWEGSTLSAKVIGTDPDSDMAVIKVEDAPAGLLKPVTLADSTQLKVGQLAVAIGNPFGLQGTMTVGFISSLGRLLPAGSDNPQGGGYTIPDVIQTDAPINPGNSGGALVDYQGRLIGVTTAIVSPVRASASIGFAVPSVIVQKVVPVLITQGKYEHPWLGISGVSLNPDLARAMNLNPSQRGALVVDVVPGGPADKAGLRGSDRELEIDGETVRVGGDVILAINGQPVKAFDDVVTYLARFTEVGQRLTLNVLRGGAEQTVQVTLAARPSERAEEKGTERTPSGPRRGAWLGITGQTMTPELAQAMDLPADQTGVLVVRIQANGPADRAGLRGSYKPVIINGQRALVGGDVIIAFDGNPVARMEDLLDFLSRAQPGDQAKLTVLRNGEQMDVTVTLGERPIP